MKKRIILFSLFLSSSYLFSQPTIQWQKTIGGNWYDDLSAIQQTVDGGYIVGGYSVSNTSGDKTENCLGYQDYWIVKLNLSGNIQWENTIGGDSIDMFTSFIQTSDGGYILGGYSRSDISGDKTENCKGNHDYWILKLDVSGVVLWDKTIGGSGEDRLYSISQTTDGSYILGGESSSNISGDKTENSKGFLDYWIVKLDNSGNIQWQKTIGGNVNDGLSSIRPTTDGGYVLSGVSGSNISGDKTDTCRGGKDYWIVKIDSLGNVGWDKTIGGSNDEASISVQQSNDSGYIVAGWSLSNISGDKTENNCSSGAIDYWIVKLDSSGSVAWQNTIGSIGDDAAYAILQATDAGYIVGGYSDGMISCDKTQNSVGPGSTDYWVLKLNSTGNIEWQKNIGGNNIDLLYVVQQTTDGGFILGGISNSNISGDKTENSKGVTDYWVVKLSPFVGIEEENNFSEFNIFPNPVNDELTIQNLGLRIERIEIYNMLGEKCLAPIFAAGERISINVSKLTPGIYFISAMDERKNSVTRKVVKM